MPSATIIVSKRNPYEDLEDRTSLRLQLSLLRGNRHLSPDIDIRVVEGSSVIEDLLDDCGDVIFILSEGVLLTYESMLVLRELIQSMPLGTVIGPVSNESTIPLQRCAPPFFYQTPLVYEWAVDAVYTQGGNRLIETHEVDDLCLVFRRETFKEIPLSHGLYDLRHGISKAKLRGYVAKGVYVHKYGNCYESAREDLLPHIPVDAEHILDIGCARGLFGERLKARQPCYVTGVDINSHLLGIARTRLDRVICGTIEEVLTAAILEEFDCIVCADVLEHLYDPWEVVRQLRHHLRPRGVLIASVPNINNWAIVYEMLMGRWDYVPFSILSGTHIRFFTKQTLMEMFYESGYVVKEALYHRFDIPPKGISIIKGLKGGIPNIAEEDELSASEIILIAERGD